MENEQHEPAPGLFVNRGLAVLRADKANVLRPLLRQTVAYRHLRDGELVARGVGWVEEVLGDDPGVSTLFTPLTITINVDAFESVQFDLAEPGCLLYTLRARDESVEIEYRAGAPLTPETPVRTWLEYRGEEYVQIELPTGAWPTINESAPEDRA
ncbi:MAG: hypothetical protein RIQ87_1048 [Chloroflexota bacterium]|jgi:hypothetical protein|nr:MAG: hypothetical protein DWI46_02880 [Chloroflexota bacterium]RLT28399.1 MAG: hypothetical protein DWI49_01535 [Chloroflexota bacterium]